jgi:hypothetical protein
MRQGGSRSQRDLLRVCVCVCEVYINMCARAHMYADGTEKGVNKVQLRSQTHTHTHTHTSSRRGGRKRACGVADGGRYFVGHILWQGVVLGDRANRSGSGNLHRESACVCE